MAFARAIAQLTGTVTTIYTAATATGETIFSLLLNCDVDSNVYLYRLNGSTSTLVAFLRLFAGQPQVLPHKIFLNNTESLQAKAMDRVSADWQTLPDWQTNSNWHNPEESLPLEPNVNIDISILK